MNYSLAVLISVGAMLVGTGCHPVGESTEGPEVDPGCPPRILSVTPQRQNGPTCLVAAGITAVSARGEILDLAAVARHVPVWPDGVHAYDLAMELARRGWESLVFTGPPEIAARVVEAGFAPVAMVGAGGARHAVTITGIERGATASGACGTALRRLRLSDPTTRQPKWVTAQAFAAMQSEGQMQVFFRPDERPLLGQRGFPLAIAQRFDRRFRATTLFRRSQKHGRTNPQRVKMLRAALVHDPCYEPARQALTGAPPPLRVEPSALPQCDARERHPGADD